MKLEIVMKYWRFISEMMRAEKVWCWPRQCDVLVFDAESNSAFNQCLDALLQSYTVESLPLLSSKVNILVLMASFFRNGSRKDAYYDCYIEKVRPKLILTYIDNNPEFYSLSVRNPQVKSMFIQNGTRGYLADIFELLDTKLSGKDFKVDYMMTFGNCVSAEYSKYISGSVVPIGSFRNNFVPKTQRKIPGTIAYVSQYRDSKGFYMGQNFYSFYDFWEQVDQIILPCLINYAKAKGKTFYIIPCSGHRDSELLAKEKAYYDKLIGVNCSYSEWQWHGSSYDVIDSTEVVVSVDSSMGLEAAARGTKSAIFSIRSQLLSLTTPPFLAFGWPGNFSDEGSFWVNRPDPAAFERILDHLFAISDEQWRSELEQQRFSEVLVYDPDNSTLKSILQKELGFERIQ